MPTVWEVADDLKENRSNAAAIAKDIGITTTYDEHWQPVLTQAEATQLRTAIAAGPPYRAATPPRQRPAPVPRSDRAARTFRRKPSRPRPRLPAEDYWPGVFTRDRRVLTTGGIRPMRRSQFPEPYGRWDQYRANGGTSAFNGWLYQGEPTTPKQGLFRRVWNRARRKR